MKTKYATDEECNRLADDLEMFVSYLRFNANLERSELEEFSKAFMKVGGEKIVVRYEDGSTGIELMRFLEPIQEH
jgi:hypothetical protein